MDRLFLRLPENLNNKSKVIVIVMKLEFILQTSSSSEEFTGLQMKIVENHCNTLDLILLSTGSNLTHSLYRTSLPLSETSKGM